MPRRASVNCDLDRSSSSSSLTDVEACSTLPKSSQRREEADAEEGNESSDAQIVANPQKRKRMSKRQAFTISDQEASQGSSSEKEKADSDEEEIVSPRKNRRTVLLSDDDAEHIVRLDLREQAREERLERLVNVGVAERRHPVPDRMHTVAKLVDGRRVFCVQPVAASADPGGSLAEQEASDSGKVGRLYVISPSPQPAANKPSCEPCSSQAADAATSSPDESKSESEAERDFIVSDSATPSFHESAGESSATAASSDASVAGKKRRQQPHCACQCRCPACRQCEFKGRTRWRLKRSSGGRDPQQRPVRQRARTASADNPTQRPGRSFGSAGSGCFLCGQPGHIARDCPTAGFNGRCFRCNASGHMARDCVFWPELSGGLN